MRRTLSEGVGNEDPRDVEMLETAPSTSQRPRPGVNPLDIEKCDAGLHKRLFKCIDDDSKDASHGGLKERRDEVLLVLRNAVNIRYDGVLKRCLHDSDEQFMGHIANVKLAVHCLQFAHNVVPVEPEFIRWMVWKFQLALTHPKIVIKMGKALMEGINVLLRALSVENRKIFITKYVIDPLADIVFCEDDSSVALKFGENTYEVAFTVCGIDGTSTMAALSLIETFRAGILSGNDVSHIDDTRLTKIWCCLIKIYTGTTFVPHDPKLSEVAVLCMESMLNKSLCRQWLLFPAFDALIGRYTILVKEGEKPPLTAATASSALKAFAVAVLQSDSKFYEELGIGEVIRWGFRYAKLAELLLQKAAGQPEVDAAFFGLKAVLMLLLPVFDLELLNEDREAFEELEKQIKVLSTRLINLVTDTIPPLVSGYLKELLSMLLMKDRIAGISHNATWIRKSYSVIESRLRAASKYEELLCLRSALAVALKCKDAEVLERDFLPKKHMVEEWIDIATTKMSPADGERMLTTMFGYIAGLSKESQADECASLALLSIPWLKVIDISMEDRYKRSLPILKEIAQLSRKCRKLLNAETMKLTLRAICETDCDGWSTWRKHIYKNAIESTDPSIVSAALESFPYFLASMKPTFHAALYQNALETIPSELVDYAAADAAIKVMEAVWRGICVGDAEHPGQNWEKCEHCDTMRKSGKYEPSVEIPIQLFEVLSKIFTDARLQKNENHLIRLRREACNILSCCLAHGIKVGLPFMQLSLAMINDIDEEVHIDYRTCFQMIVVSLADGPETDGFQEEFFKRVAVPDADFHDIPYSKRYRPTTPFIRTAALYASKASLAERSYMLMMKRWMKLDDDSPEATEMDMAVREMIKGCAAKVGISPTVYFARNSRKICAPMAAQLRMIAFTSRISYSQNQNLNPAQMEKKAKEDVDMLLENTSDMFEFENTKSFLLKASAKIAADLVLDYLPGQYEKGDVFLCLQRLVRGVDRHKVDFLTEIFPNIIEGMISPNYKHGFSRTVIRLREFYKEFANVDLDDAWKQKRFHVIYAYLRCLTYDPDKVMHRLSRALPEGHPAEKETARSITEVLRFNCEYMGFLLCFRRHLVDDDNFEIRDVLLDSLQFIVTHLDQNFLDTIAIKFLILLRAISDTLGKRCVPLWCAFATSISSKRRGQLLPQILIAIEPLCAEEDSKILHVLFNQSSYDSNEGGSIRRTARVISWHDSADSTPLSKYLRRQFGPIEFSNEIVEDAIKMLEEHCDVVGRVVLQRLIANLDGSPLEEKTAGLLGQVLLSTIRHCGQADVRELAVRCLGRMCAVDPGRVGLSLAHRMVNRSNKVDELVFPDSGGDGFQLYVLERSYSLYAAVSDAEQANQVEYSLQGLLQTMHGSQLLPKISSEQCRMDLEPLLTSKLALATREPYPTSNRPIVQHYNNYSEWMLRFFCSGQAQIRMRPFDEIFRHLATIVTLRDVSFMREMLIHVLIQLIVEDNKEYIGYFAEEMQACMEAALVNSGWQRLAATAVFSLMDALEIYVARNPKSKEGQRAAEVLNKTFAIQTAEGITLAVLAAEKCGCLLRALRWCEQVAIGGGKASQNGPEKKRVPFYVLERIYAQIEDVDGVQGAWETIRKSVDGTADEQILALEAIGDYNRALPLYEQCTENKEPRLLKALIRLNQSQLALPTAEALYQEYADQDVAPSLKRAIEDLQIEATWHLHKWDKLGQLIEDFKPNSSSRETSWGASCASVLHAVRKKDPDLIQAGITASRNRVTDRLMGTTLEDSDSYAQSYKHITELHILDEIEEFTRCPSTPFNIDKIMQKWEARSELVVQDMNVLEPILSVRRELLANEQNAESTCRLLLQSSRLARQAGQLQISWTYLSAAQSFDVCKFETGIEEARYLFQMNAAPASISLLTKMLEGEGFYEMNQLFEKLKSARDSQSREAAAVFVEFPEEKRRQYSELQLLAAEYKQKAGTRDHNDLYPIYKNLPALDIKSEDLFYRIAVFYDANFEKTVEMGSKNADELVKIVLTHYITVLHHGSQHAVHVMPRILTIWLDYTETKQRKLVNERNGVQREATRLTIEAVCNIVQNAYAQLNPLHFFQCFNQLLTRICHPSETVFDLIKEILSDLILKYPHQCIWHSISLFRPDNEVKVAFRSSGNSIVEKEKFAALRLRLARIHRVYEVVMTNDPRMGDMIDQYDYVAGLMLELANKNIRNGKQKMADNARELYEFFATGKMYTESRTRDWVKNGKLDVRVATPRNKAPVIMHKKMEIMIPYSDLMLRAVHFVEHKTASFSQCIGPGPSAGIDDLNESSMAQEVFIQGFAEDLYVFSSLVKPKKFTIRGRDGKNYEVMVKGGDDELRKDGRFNDVNRMMNSLMRRNPAARRRQLNVKTYSAIPLAGKGGIMEFLPHLDSYRSVVTTLAKEKPRVPAAPVHNFDHFSRMPDQNRIDILRRQYYPAYPLVMAEWLRKTFADPCSWHSARLAYARSAAVMSMIGFVMGLGDRHAENMMLDTVDGMVVHVDLQLIFNKGEELPVPECVPFRLTRNMVDGFGPTGVEGAFRKSCETTMSETLLTLISTFLHDPLLEFYKAAEKERREGTRQIMAVDAEKMTSAAKEQYAKKSVTLIKRRLEGHIVSGKRESHAAPMIVEGQVDRLIEMATDELALSRMWLGWAAYL
ncbi:unnamed protein product, partial [Mesorhabditis spiculigera]